MEEEAETRSERWQVEDAIVVGVPCLTRTVHVRLLHEMQLQGGDQ